MKRNEQPLFNRIPYGKSKFHSAILTSFNVNFQFFETQVLRILNDKYISSINVLVDQKQLNESFDTMTDVPVSAGTRYSVNAITSPGAFHPKMNFILGNDDLLLLVGSGNLTYGGHGLNHELFTGFYANQKDKTHQPLIKEAWQYLKQFENQIAGYGRDRIFKEVFSDCNLLKGNATTKHVFYEIADKNYQRCALLYNEKEDSLLNQIQRLIPLKGVRQIEILSPYYDADGEFLITLYDLCPNLDGLSVLMQKNCVLPPADIKIGERNINFFDYNAFESNKANHKFLHAKAIILHTTTHDYLIVGSANATCAAFGSLKTMPINDEFCVLYESDPGFSKKAISLDKFEKLQRITTSDMTKHQINDQEDNHTDSFSYPISLQAADYSSKTLSLSCTWKGNIVDSELCIQIYSDEGELTFSKPIHLFERIQMTISLSKNDKMVRITDKNGNYCSGVVMINHCDELIYTSPSRKFSRMLEIYQSMLNGSYADLEISSYLADLYADIEQETQPKSSSSKSKHVKVINSVDSSDDLVALQNKILEESQDENNSLDITKNRVPHFYDHLMNVLTAHSEIKMQLSQDKEEENNEDAWDSGSVETRSIDDTVKREQAPMKANDFYYIRWSAKYLAERYLKLCRKLYFGEAKKEQIDETDLMYYILVMHYLIQMCLWNPCEMDFSEDEKKHCKTKTEKDEYYKNLKFEYKELEKFWSYASWILVSNFSVVLLDYHNSGKIDKSSLKYESLAKQVLNYTLLFFNERDLSATYSTDEAFISINVHPLINIIEVLGPIQETEVKKFSDLICEYYDLGEINGLFSIYKNAILLRDDKIKFKFVPGHGYMRIKGKNCEAVKYNSTTSL